MIYALIIVIAIIVSTVAVYFIGELNDKIERVEYRNEILKSNIELLGKKFKALEQFLEIDHMVRPAQDPADYYMSYKKICPNKKCEEEK